MACFLANDTRISPWNRDWLCRDSALSQCDTDTIVFDFFSHHCDTSDSGHAKKKPIATQARPTTYPVAHQVVIVIASLLIGICSVLFGIGGGTLMLPLFLMLRLTIREASGTSTLCGMIAAVISTLLLSLTQGAHPYLNTSGYIYWPAALAIAASSVCFAPLGARLAFKLPIPVLKRLFAIVLCISAWFI